MVLSQSCKINIIVSSCAKLVLAFIRSGCFGYTIRIYSNKNIEMNFLTQFGCPYLCPSPSFRINVSCVCIHVCTSPKIETYFLVLEGKPPYISVQEKHIVNLWANPRTKSSRTCTPINANHPITNHFYQLFATS